MAAAAVFALAVALWLLASNRAVHDGSGRVWRPDDAIALRPGEHLDLDFPDGSRIAIDDAHAVLGRGEPRLRLDDGRIAVEVPPGVGGLRIAVPDGEVAVLGTIFSVSVDPLAVSIAVTRGQVAWRPASGDGRTVAAGTRILLPRNRAGWSWEPNSDRPRIVTRRDGGLEIERPSAGGIGYTNMSADWSGLPPVRLSDASGEPGAELNILAIERDGDVWLIANHPLGRMAAGFAVVLPAAGPFKLQVAQGDHIWNRATVRRIVISLWGGTARVSLDPLPDRR